MLKAVYRNDDIKERAYEIAENTMKLLAVSVMVKDDGALPNFCEAAAIAIVSELSGDIMSNINKTVKARNMAVDKKDMAQVVGVMSELFFDEMEAAGKIGMMDARAWANRAEKMGSNQAVIAQGLSKAWADNSLPTFKDFWARVYRAIDGYINSCFQMAVLYAN